MKVDADLITIGAFISFFFPFHFTPGSVAHSLGHSSWLIQLIGKHNQIRPLVTCLDGVAMSSGQKISNIYSQLACLSHPRSVNVCRLAWVHNHTLSSIMLAHTTQEVAVSNLKSNWVWLRNKRWIWVGTMKPLQFWKWEGILVRILSISLPYRLGTWVSGVQLHKGMWWWTDGKPGFLGRTRVLPTIGLWLESFQFPP